VAKKEEWRGIYLGIYGVWDSIAVITIGTQRLAGRDYETKDDVPLSRGF
jgi:hypothetical protein